MTNYEEKRDLISRISFSQNTTNPEENNSVNEESFSQNTTNLNTILSFTSQNNQIGLRTNTKIAKIALSAESPAQKNGRVSEKTFKNTAYTYNPRNELIASISEKSSETFSYDNLGNRISTVNSDETKNYTTNNLNQYINISETAAVAETSNPGSQSMGNEVLSHSLSPETNAIAETSNPGHLASSHSLSPETKAIAETSNSETAAIVETLNSANASPGDSIGWRDTPITEIDIRSFNPFRFSSEYHDDELSLIYYNYRHYNPATGRFLSRDPIEEQGGTNLYNFTANNPINYFDLLGEDITVETGNESTSEINNRFHQNVCVEIWSDKKSCGEKNKKKCCYLGKVCFSFGVGEAKFQLPQFSKKWLGWNSLVIGAILKGKIYESDEVRGAIISSRHRTIIKQDKKWLDYMMSKRLGKEDAYSIVRHNCRMYSQLEFKDAPLHFGKR